MFACLRLASPVFHGKYRDFIAIVQHAYTQSAQSAHISSELTIVLSKLRQKHFSDNPNNLRQFNSLRMCFVSKGLFGES